MSIQLDVEICCKKKKNIKMLLIENRLPGSGTREAINSVKLTRQIVEYVIVNVKLTLLINKPIVSLPADKNRLAKNNLKQFIHRSL